MAVCVFVQVHQSLYGVKEADLIALLKERAAIEEKAVLTHRKEDVAKALADARKSPGGVRAAREAFNASIEAMLASFRSGEMTGNEDALYQKWLKNKQHEEELRRHDISQRLAYHPKDRVSIGLLSSAFAHAGWFHLLGNMLFLYMVGCNLEDRWGRVTFAGMYLAGAAVSALVYGAWHHWAGPGLVGASGAIAAGMGAFLVCYHRARIRMLLLIMVTRPRIVEIYAFWALPAWFLLQGLNALYEAKAGSGVAYSAHLGGFAFGALMAVGLKVSTLESRWLLPATAKGVEWHEDPSFVSALDMLKAGNNLEAIPLLQTVVKRNPRHEAAWEHLARLAILSLNSQLASTALANYVGLLPRNRLREAVAMLRETQVLDKQLALNDRALFLLLRATIANNDGATGLSIAKRLAEEFPQSSYLPGALWELAKLQEDAGRPDLAASTLAELVAKFPDDAFAARAEAKLRESEIVDLNAG